MIPAEIRGLDHVVLRVTDITRTIAFYQDVLGLRLERIFEPIRLHQMRCGRNLIDLVAMLPGETLPPPENRGIEHLCINVHGIVEEIEASFAAMSVPLSAPIREVYGAGGFGTSLYVRDPDGYEIEIKVHYARTPQRFGAPPVVPA